MWTKTRLELIGSEVQLFCRTQGFPKPSVTWLGPDGKLLTRTDKATVLDSGDLILRDLSWSDMGGYQCVAANEDGQDQTTTFLYPILVSYSRISFLLLPLLLSHHLNTHLSFCPPSLSFSLKSLSR